MGDGSEGRAVVQDQVEAADPPTPDAPEEQLQEALELDEPFALKAAGQGLAGVHQQGGEPLHRAPALIAIRDVQRPAGPRRGRTPARPPGLNRRLLVRADEEVTFPGECLSALVERQDRDGPFQEARVGGTLPAVITPRLDAIGLKPALDRGA
jgi:hypothetical protein